MNIDVWTKNATHRKAIAALPTLKARIQYIVDHADKPKYRAMPMVDLETWEDVYYPRLGPFVFREHEGFPCQHRTAEDAAHDSDTMLELFVKYLKNESDEY